MQSATTEQQASTLPPLIGREILFGNPERTSPRLSPDGKYLAYIAPMKKMFYKYGFALLGRKMIDN